MSRGANHAVPSRYSERWLARLKALWFTPGQSVHTIARELNASTDTIKREGERLGLPPRAEVYQREPIVREVRPLSGPCPYMYVEGGRVRTCGTHVQRRAPEDSQYCGRHREKVAPLPGGRIDKISFIPDGRRHVRRP